MSKLKFELEEGEVNLVLGALGRMPYEAVADLINNIRSQAIPQLRKESNDGIEKNPKQNEITHEEARIPTKTR